jgi:glycosyltransferase involved in cell wall biosynthesis
MNAEPLVSILMTSYNREAYIAEAIQSVLGSSYKNWELIVCDDGSTDNTVNIARAYELKDPRIKVYENKINLGDYLNRNRAASYAKGKYLKYVDADDVLYYFGIELAVRLTEQFPEAGFGLGSFPDDHHPCPILVKPREIYLEHFLRYSHFDRAPGSGLIKRSVFEEIGGFSGRRMIGDYEFWFKIARSHSMVKIPIDTYWNRLHPEQESQTEYAKKNYERLRKEVLQEGLGHPDCPLTKDDLKIVLEHIHRNNTKNSLIKSMGRLRKLISFDADKR